MRMGEKEVGPWERLGKVDVSEASVGLGRIDMEESHG